MKKYFLYFVIILTFLLSGNLTFIQAADLPDSMKYEYRQYSYWAGSSDLNVNISSEGVLDIEYVLSMHSDSNFDPVGPFNESFSATYVDAFDSWDAMFSPNINTSSMEEWHTARETSGVGMCDGGGFTHVLEMLFDSSLIVLEHIIDNDSCSGTRTSKNSPDIEVQMSFLHSFVINLVNDRGMEPEKIDLTDDPTDVSNSTLPFTNKVNTLFVSIGIGILVLINNKKK